MLRRAILAAALSTLFATAVHGQTLSDTRLRLETWGSGLSSPTTFTWIGPFELLVFEKDTGKVKWIKDGMSMGTVLDLNVQNDSERGGLGIVADPDFANNHYVYLYWSMTSATKDSSATNNWVENRLDRYEWNGSALVNQFGPLLAFLKDSNQSNGPNHDGGPIRFGPDGKLYGQIGEMNRGRMGGGAERIEQNTATSMSSMVGGVYRINSDGTIPSDNPFVSESDANLHLWFEYGFRNGFGMTWDPLTGIMWNTENGPDKYDEINRVDAGMNSGWLKIMGPDSRDARYGENNNTKYDASDLTYLANSFYRDPELSFLTTIGITAIEFIASDLFPEDMRYDVFFGDVNNQCLYLAHMDSTRLAFKLSGGLADKVADTNGERKRLVAGTSFGGITDIHLGADGYLYMADIGLGKIFRLRPVTDLVAPASFHVELGHKTGGKLKDLDVSDDQYFRLNDALPTPVAGVIQGTATYKLNDAAPTQIDLAVECNVSLRDCLQEIQILNLNPSHPPQWQTLDVRPASFQTDQQVVLAALPNPSDYVDPATHTVQARLIVRDLRSTRLTNQLPPRTLVLQIDQMRLSVTYP